MSIDSAVMALLGRLERLERQAERRQANERGFSTVPRARAYHNANQSIGNATWTVSSLNTEVFDTDNMHSTSVNTSRMTCNTAGLYIIIGQIRFAGNATGARGCRIMLNNTTQIGINFASANPDGNVVMPNAVTLYNLAVNDYVEMQGYQSSGGNLNIDTDGNSSPALMVVWVGTAG